MLSNLYFIGFISLSMVMFFSGLYFLNMNIQLIFEYNLISLNSVFFNFVISMDWMSLLFMSFVFFISSMVMLYSKEYMSMEIYMERFIYLLLLFVFSMMFMIFSPNLISILLGWDGLGLVSYALVIFYQNEKSFNAGMLTALSNRIGDAALLMSIALTFNFGSWNLFNFMEFYSQNFNSYLVGLFIILAAMTKSAQIPFSSWLPAAMAAPTPVSSLVHSSTLVTAGVYLLIRFSDLFDSVMLKILMYLSLMTMFMAGLGANFEFDLKKIIALSTLSQLGMMIFILCVGNKDLAFFHLLIHAFFKALLFMCAGAMIHNLGNMQDIRFMGGLIKFMPLTCLYFNISSFALCGLPFLSGFYSKDLVAEALSMKIMSIFVYVIFYISVGLTVSYSFRLIYYVFMGDYNFISMNSLSDNNNMIMLKSMSGLILLVIFMGSCLSWFILSIPYFIFLPLISKLLTIIMILMGMIMGLEIANKKFYYNMMKLSKFNYFFFSNMWNMPILSTLGVNFYFLKLGKMYYKNMDHGWFEYYGSKGLFSNLKFLIKIIQQISKNHLKSILLMVLFMYLIMVIICEIFKF